MRGLLFLAVAWGEVFFEEDFSGDWEQRWTRGQPPGKPSSEMGAWRVTPGEWYADADRDRGLSASEDSRFYAISAPLDAVATSRDKTLVVQFTAKMPQMESLSCGGGYIKLLPPGFEPATFSGEDAYQLMFGPDVCGKKGRIHAILRHEEENLQKTEELSLKKRDQMTHLYTWALHPNGTYSISVDLEPLRHGEMLRSDWPLPQPQIDDPSDAKPDDWVDDAEIDDPEAVKPDGYDDMPAEIADETATRPDDWDDDDDGAWEPPLVPNPQYAGPWRPPRVANPAYRGAWRARQMDNPKYRGDVQLAAYDVAYVGFEIWVVQSGTIFDNVLITDDVELARARGETLWRATSSAEVAAKEAWARARDFTSSSDSKEEL